MVDENQSPSSPTIILRRPSSWTVLAVLIGIFVTLAALDVLAVALGKNTAASLLSLDAEVTIGTWWAGVQLVALAGLLFVLSLREADVGDEASVRALRLGVLVATYLSIDEVAGVHELLSVRLGREPIPLLGRDLDRWLVLYTVVALIVIILAAPGLVRLWRANRVDWSWLGLGAALVLLGGVIVDQVRRVIDPGVWDVIFEESFEFIGVAVMIWAAYRMLSTISISSPPPN